MKKNKDNYVFLVCILLVCGFVFLLPYISRTIIKKNEFKEENEIPTHYRCKMSWKHEDSGYVLNQDAVYTINDTKVVKAEIHREYLFDGEENYLKWKEANGQAKNVTGQVENIKFDDINLKVTRDTTRNILEMRRGDLEDTFPRTYPNLLIYTQDQDCKAE